MATGMEWKLPRPGDIFGGPEVAVAPEAETRMI